MLLLCYLLGYIRDSAGAHSYYGSNATISKDLGIAPRTLQRRLKDLSEIGYIEVIINNYSERHIYVNYERIFSNLTKILVPEYDSLTNINMCAEVVQYFISKNYLENTKIEQYATFLRMKYLTELSKNKIPDALEFLYRTLADELKLNYAFVEDGYREARQKRIAEINKSITA